LLRCITSRTVSWPNMTRLASVPYAQLRNNAELAQRIRSGGDPDVILLEMLSVGWSTAYRDLGQGLLVFS
jgi:hypothetical protein